MRISTALLFGGGLLVAEVLADNVQYNVVSSTQDGQTMGVSVDGSVYPLQSDELCEILHVGSAPAANKSYQYVKIAGNEVVETEPFERTPVLENKTLNEHYNRTINKWDIRELPNILPPLPIIDRVDSKLHRSGEIPTINLVGDQTDFDTMHNNISDDIDIKATMTYIGLDDVLDFEDVQVSLAGRSSRWLPKLSYNLKLHQDDLLYEYKNLKLRASAYDPSYIREHLTYAALDSVGVPASHNSFVRLYINNEPVGLFGVLEPYKTRWVQNEFAKGDADYENGIAYQAKAIGDVNSFNLSVLSDLSYHENKSLYKDGSYEISVDPANGQSDFESLIDFTKFLANAPTTGGNASIEEWNKHIDTDGVLRSMAMEVLFGYGDGYLYFADNYYLYKDPKTDRFVYIPADLDMTLANSFGDLSSHVNQSAFDYPELRKRPLTQQMLSVPEFNYKFQQLLIDINKGILDPAIIDQKINDTVAMIREDVDWDKTLTRMGNYSLTGDANTNVNVRVLTDMASALHNTTTLDDFVSRLRDDVPFDVALNGPTGHVSLMGVREWVHKRSAAIYEQYQDGIQNATLNE